MLGIATTILVLGVVTAFEATRDTLIDDARLGRPLDAVAVVDREGRPLRHYLPDGVDTRWVTLDAVDADLIAAFIAAEDERFYEHGGIDGIAIARAFLGNLMGSRLSGASTLTQQVVKLAYGRPHGLWDKPIEMARAIELEARMSKDEILEQYLNRVPMGNGIVGVARAAEVYFGHDVSELSLAEAALLAGIPQAPSITEPRRHLARALRRRSYVLDRLLELERASRAEITAARESVPMIRRAAPRPYGAPRFVDRVLATRSRDALISSPLRTTLDAERNAEAETLLLAAIEPLRSRGAENAAAIALDARTGAVLVYVGAADADGEGGALDLLLARRQPGSTLKPFAYELLFEAGESPATLLDDSAGRMTLGDGSTFVARDFDGFERGRVRARVALASSLNLAAIDVVRRTGPSSFVDRLSALGFASAPVANRESAALVLGGIDVSAVELARAYATLARGGRPLDALRVIESDVVDGPALLQPIASALTVDVLRDGPARAIAFGRDLEDEAGGPFALKTGTSEGFHDAWSVAFDARFVVVVWVGSPARRAMDAISGFEGAAPSAARILGRLRQAAPLLAPDESGAVEAPALATVVVCAASGELPSTSCDHVVSERFDPRHVPYAHCAGAHDLPSTDVAAHPRVRSPVAGATLVVSRADGEIPILTDGASALEIDGRPATAGPWFVGAGHHVIIAVNETSRARPVAFTVRAAD
jgi:penicillin-binding protein 1C